MATSEVEYREEWLILVLAVFPMAFFSRRIPYLRRSRVLELIVSFAVVGAIVASFSEVHRKRFQPFWQLGITTHVVCANAVLVHAGDDGGTAWCTNTSSGEGVRVTDTLGSHLVQIGSDCVRIAVASQVRANVLAGNPQDVGTRWCRIRFDC